MKRFISIVLAVVMIMAMAAVSVSAAEVSNSAGADTSASSTGADNLIYFDAGKWSNYQTIFCHIWVRGGDAYFAWQSKKEACKQVKGSLYSYDLSALETSTLVEGGLKSGVDYCVIFSANTGVQTFDQTMGLECIGDTAKVTGKMIENAVDSEKEAYESVWTKNSSKYGPHLAISSIGNIIGSKLCPNEKNYEVIGDWLPTYSSHTNFDVVDTLAKAYPKFGVDSIEEVAAAYLYIEENKTDVDEKDLKLMKSQLEEAYAKAYPSKGEDEVVIDDKALDDAKDVVDNDTPDNSGSGKDGQEHTILFVLLGVMLLAGGTVVVSRKKREE